MAGFFLLPYLYLHPALNTEKIIIAGGGLAGLTAALHLSRAGYPVSVLEKETYPRHKVCGEYISNEVLPYLNSLGVDPFELGAVPISTFEFSDQQGRKLQADLPLGGFGISRFLLDDHLRERAVEAGCEILQEQVEAIQFKTDQFEIKTLSGRMFEARLVIGAHGKRSGIDVSLSRDFISKKTPWLGIKAHYKGDFDSSKVGLHNFKGGYCGISKVEDDRINVCYLTHLESFKKYKDPETYREEVLRRNPELDAFFSQAEMLFDKPLSISQISFERKELVVDHILMCGDSASLIHPLCGNGMAMAIMGAKILSESIQKHVEGNRLNRNELERMYAANWKAHFSGRLKAGKILQTLLRNERATAIGLNVMRKAPFLMRQIIKTTHGKPLSS